MKVQVFKGNTSGPCYSGSDKSNSHFTGIKAACLPHMMTTEEVAKALHVMPNSIRSALSKTGSYMGLKPVKLPNRRLVWCAEAVSALLKTGEMN